MTFCMDAPPGLEGTALRVSASWYEIVQLSLLPQSGKEASIFLADLEGRGSWFGRQRQLKAEAAGLEDVCSFAV